MASTGGQPGIPLNTLPAPNPDPENGPEGAEDEEERKRPTLKEIPLGYSYVAAFIDADEDFAVFRRFGTLKARVLLAQQAELEERELKLARIDKAEEVLAAQEEKVADNSTWINDNNTERRALIADIAEKLRRYEKDMLLYGQMLNLAKPQDWQRRNFKNMLYNEAPLYKTESQFLDDKEDLITLRKGNDDSVELWEPVSALFNRALTLVGRVLFRKKPPRAFEDNEDASATSKTGMNAVARLFFGLIVSIIVLSGVIVLYFVSSDHGRLIVLCCATFMCAVLTSLLTKARKSEVFGVAAAYCAVLVVFVGTTLNKDNSTVMLQYGNTLINGTIESS
ncbi:hypothetical protein ABW19_dt0206471 [Dactylella cylindrospora]|nr:hypothetical protein ABW19_dt0206471 [Dactylella cylindrospora]